MGMVDVQYGKNLLDVHSVIGVGGIFRYGDRPERVLPAAKYSLKYPESLRPTNPDYFIDKSYIIYAVGLLSQDYPDEALRIAKKYLVPVDKDTLGHSTEIVDYAGRLNDEGPDPHVMDAHGPGHNLGALMGGC